MYHYTECGLNNIWLENGYREKKTPYGKAVAIERADDLHAAIADRLVNRKPSLSGGEFRFIRKELGLSQAALAHILGNDAQTVARWEKSGRVPKMGERFLRALYREREQGNAKIDELIEHLNTLDERRREKLLFAETRSGWEPKAA